MAANPAHSGSSATSSTMVTRLPRPFRLLIMAGFASLTGDGVRAAALPLYTAVSTHSPLAASAVATAEVLPWLLIALPAGTLVDRWPPRAVVLVAHTLRALAMIGLAAAVITHHAGVGLLVAAAFVLTCAETFADPAFQLLLVELAGRDHLERANGWYVSAETLGLDLAGPLLAGALVVWQPGAAFALTAGMFVVSAACVAALPNVAVLRDIPTQRRAGTVRAQLAQGTRFLLRERALRVLVLAVVCAAVAVAAANTLIALYAIGPLRVPAALVPTLWVAQSIGTLVAARVVARLAPRFGEGRVMVGALALLGVGFVVVGAFAVPAVVWFAYLLVGAGAGGWNVLSATRRQRLTPSALMGRVTSAYRMLAWGLMPLGAALAGPLAQRTSLGTVFVLAGVVLVTVVAVLGRQLVRTGEQPAYR